MDQLLRLVAKSSSMHSHLRIASKMSAAYWQGESVHQFKTMAQCVWVMPE